MLLRSYNLASGAILSLHFTCFTFHVYHTSYDFGSFPMKSFMVLAKHCKIKRNIFPANILLRERIPATKSMPQVFSFCSGKSFPAEMFPEYFP